MTPATERWIWPLLDSAARVMTANEIRVAVRRAMFPARESLDPRHLEIAKRRPYESYLILDWIRFGQLLIEHLDLVDYPPRPDGAPPPDAL